MQRGGLYDLDEMVLRCHGPSAKEYVEEAVSTYRVGAYRSCIIATWIAVYFDLAAKIRSLGLAGNQEAIKWTSTFESHSKHYEPGRYNTAQPLQRIESEILNKAQSDDFALLTRMEVSDLKRLREDRHRCAHPTLINQTERFDPSPELARTHLRAAIEHVLSKPAIRGKLAVQRLLNLARDEGFPVFTPQAQEVFKDAEVSLLDSGSVKGLLAELFADVTDLETNSATRLRRVTALDAMRNLLPQEFHHCFQDILDAYIKSEPEWAWRMIFAVARRKQWMLTYLGVLNSNKAIAAINNADIGSTKDVMMILDALYLDGLQDCAISKLADLEPYQMNQYSDQIPVPALLNEAISRLEKSGSWNRSHQLITELIEPHVANIEKPMVNKVLSAYRKNANVVGSYAAAPLLLKMLKTLDTNVLANKYAWLSTIQVMEKLSPETKSEIQREIDNSFSENRVPF